LVGHVARANPHSALLIDGAEVCALFHGPHGYISPTWYVDENPRWPNVPTWNYVAVHAYGRARRIDEEGAKWKIVAGLTAQYEGINPSVGPADWKEHAPQLEAIVGFEVIIDRIEAKTKLSQNRSPADQRRVIEKLEAAEHPDGRVMARLMRENMDRKVNR
jgi:transcriptional regulator